MAAEQPTRQNQLLEFPPTEIRPEIIAWVKNKPYIFGQIPVAERESFLSCSEETLPDCLNGLGKMWILDKGLDYEGKPLSKLDYTSVPVEMEKTQKAQLYRYPLLSDSQQTLAFIAYQIGEPLKTLKEEIAFISDFKLKDMSRVNTLFNDSNNVFDLIFYCNTRLVFSLAKKIRQNRRFDDVVQMGNLGLMKAIEKFDPLRDIRFASYSSPTIIHTISRELIKEGSVIFPSYFGENLSLAERILNEETDILYKSLPLTAKTTQQITDSLALYSEFSSAQIKILIEVFNSGIQFPISLQQKHRNPEAKLSLVDHIADPTENTEEKIILKNENTSVIFNDIIQEFKTQEKTARAFSDRNNQILLSYLSGLSFEEVGEKFGITKQRAEQITNRSLKHIRSHPRIWELWDD